jgi:hypothetical protein
MYHAYHNSEAQQELESIEGDMQYRVGAEYAASNTYSLALFSTWIQPLGFTLTKSQQV